MPAANYEQPDRMAKEESGATLASPYMTLSFMALLVIPHLMLSDKGLFDRDRFEIIKRLVAPNFHIPLISKPDFPASYFRTYYKALRRVDIV
jgi:hypothetical protein